MISIQGKQLCFGDFIEIIFKISLCSDVYGPFCFQTWYDDSLDSTLHFGTSLNDLDLHSRSQGYKKIRTCAVILLK